MTHDPHHDPASPGGAVDQLAAKDKRIAELEAELAETKKLLEKEGEKVGEKQSDIWRLDEDYHRELAMREKAEAEVERLKAVCESQDLLLALVSE